MSVCLQISPDCKYQQTTAFFSVGHEKFSISGKKLISPGFTEFMPWQAIPAEESMPEFKTNDIYPIYNVITSNTSRYDYLITADCMNGDVF